jgi:hypothetical protein
MSRIHHTIRNNVFDNEFIKQTAIYIDEDGIEHSINKDKNWELLNDPDIKQIKYHRDVEGEMENVAVTNHRPEQSGGIGNMRCSYKRGRDYVTVNGIRQNDDFKLEEQRNCIILPFLGNEYPINREPHICHDGPCPTCFRHTGRIWQLKGLGDKSVGKNKGMKRDKQRDYRYFHEL